MSLMEKIFGDLNEKEVKKVSKIADKVMAYDEEYQKLTDQELRDKTQEFKKRIQEGETLDALLPEAFAVCREGAWRSLGMKHFYVQVIGGIVLHQGRISEMKTGEGKTLVATLPAYLNALEGKGVHVVTVNDYLAKRDMEWMGKLYTFLGLTVGCVIHGITEEERRAAYNADITYGTNNEYGFDYLRDNMVIYKEDMMQRELNYAIIDEVDSILIDEARTPLIISGKGDKSTDMYTKADGFVRTLKKDDDFTVEEKDKQISLTEDGVAKCEAYFNVENFSDPENMEINHHVLQALKARNMMKRDVDYIVRDGEVIIIDEFTGRMMFGRRYSDGLHQAIEAKEHVLVRSESKTLATITLQNYFRMYQKLSGMTGTAKTEEGEFRDIYNMDVVVIPTNKPIARNDLKDAVYATEHGKYKSIVDAVESAHKKGQPVLVGTISIEKSELIATMLRKRGIKDFNILNAKHHEKEAQIIAQAGRLGAITIATNMAGRGTDIKLDDESKAAGGLKIIGTERHESRRIDNQLRGRSGRQGDPGESRFYISLEDDLMRLFGSERLMKIFTSLGVAENEQIEHKMLSNAIEKAQEKIEFNNFGIRKNLLDYDQVNNEQREIIYKERRQVLDGENMRDAIYNMIQDTVDSYVDMCFSDDVDSEEWDLNEFNGAISPIIPLKPLTPESVKGKRRNEIKHELKEEAVKLYEAKEAEFPEPEQLRELERVVLLKSIDSKWMDHIDDMEILRQGIGLAAYGQRDPVVEYKMNAFDMFNEMINSIQEDTLRMLYHVHVEQKIEREQVAKVTGTNKDDSGVKKPVQRKEIKVYPNDPCPCGSGKKYKQCCGRKKPA